MARTTHKTCAATLASLERHNLVEVSYFGHIRTAKLNEGHAIISDLMTGSGRVDLVVLNGHREDVTELTEAFVSGIDERYGIEIEFRVFGFADMPVELI